MALREGGVEGVGGCKFLSIPERALERQEGREFSLESNHRLFELVRIRTPGTPGNKPSQPPPRWYKRE